MQKLLITLLFALAFTASARAQQLDIAIQSNATFQNLGSDVTIVNGSNSILGLYHIDATNPFPASSSGSCAVGSTSCRNVVVKFKRFGDATEYVAKLSYVSPDQINVTSPVLN